MVRTKTGGRIRNFSTRLQVQALAGSTAADSRGNTVKAFATIDEVYASVSPLSGRELNNARHISATVTHSVEMHRNSNVTPRVKLYDGNALAYYNVERVLDDGRYMSLLVQEVV